MLESASTLVPGFVVASAEIREENATLLVSCLYMLLLSS